MKKLIILVISISFFFVFFQISDPLYKRELRLTFEDYMLYKFKVGRSNASLSYDRGFMITYSPIKGTDFFFEIVWEWYRPWR